MKLLIALYMLKMIVLIEKVVLGREMKFKVSETGADNCNVTVRRSKTSWQRPRCYRMSEFNSWINSNYSWPTSKVNIRTPPKWTQRVEYFFHSLNIRKKADYNVIIVKSNGFSPLPSLPFKALLRKHWKIFHKISFGSLAVLVTKYSYLTSIREISLIFPLSQSNYF